MRWRETLRTSSKTRRLSVSVEVPIHESKIGVVVDRISAASGEYHDQADNVEK
jgi:hypothetical protein